MKIEKVNDKTIRCTLTKNDLTERQIKLSELAYGTEKARGFFKDMIQQASYQFGFEAEDIPLMIEAIPLSGEAIVLVITKVEDPEELDTRFSRFAPDLKDDSFTPDDSVSGVSNYGADDVIDLVKRLHDTIQNANKALKGNQHLLQDVASAEAAPDTVSPDAKNIQITVPVDIVKLYAFKNMDVLIELAHILKGLYDGQNTLYKEESDDCYYLIIRKSSLSPETFNKVCNIITEYATVENYTPSVQAYFDEHATPVISGNALQMLAEI
ncbi:MAG: adaptor protein MecA [Lachnospiraceae bacterium]|nr:adaptor protein MecA [Lachnospiraceae bacterium]